MKLTGICVFGGGVDFKKCLGVRITAVLLEGYLLQFGLVHLYSLAFLLALLQSSMSSFSNVAA